MELIFADGMPLRHDLGNMSMVIDASSPVAQRWGGRGKRRVQDGRRRLMIGLDVRAERGRRAVHNDGACCLSGIVVVVFVVVAVVVCTGPATPSLIYPWVFISTWSTAVVNIVNMRRLNVQFVDASVIFARSRRVEVDSNLPIWIHPRGWTGLAFLSHRTRTLPAKNRQVDWIGLETCLWALKLARFRFAMLPHWSPAASSRGVALGKQYVPLCIKRRVPCV